MSFNKLNTAGQKQAFSMFDSVRTIVLAVGFLFLCSALSQAQTRTLNVADFGARGDSVRFFGMTTSNSAVVTVLSTNQFSDADDGKLIQLFGVGTPTTPTDYQDMIATVVSVKNGTNLTISIPPSASSNNVYCVLGTQNSEAFQKCIDAAGTNALITIPNGTYLLVPPKLLTASYSAENMYSVVPAVVITNGGIRIVGESTNAVLLGNGAWMLKTDYVQRGMIFFLQGPVLDDGSISFENLTFDGGVQIGNRTYRGFPARSTDGDGWDMSHGAVLDVGEISTHRMKLFTNCAFVHWRGEILKSITANIDSLLVLKNCQFYDGNASALNFTGTYDVEGCAFDLLDMAMEFYIGYSFGDSLFKDNRITRVRSAFVICGALTNNPRPTVLFTNNSISATDIGIMMSPARHVTIVGNTFLDMATGIMPNAMGYQGTDHSGDFLIENNLFTNTYYAFQNAADSGASRLENVIIRNNTANSYNTFAYGYGWNTNVVFLNNTGVKGGIGLNSSLLTGECYVDDSSNQFPPYEIWDYNNDSGAYTNSVTYCFGMRHRIAVAQTNSIYCIDDTKPFAIPSGAVLVLSNSVNRAVTVYLSNTSQTAPLTLESQGALSFRWTNSAWRVVLPPPAPPSALRVVPR